MIYTGTWSVDTNGAPLIFWKPPRNWKIIQAKEFSALIWYWSAPMNPRTPGRLFAFIDIINRNFSLYCSYLSISIAIVACFYHQSKRLWSTFSGIISTEFCRPHSWRFCILSAESFRIQWNLKLVVHLIDEMWYLPERYLNIRIHLVPPKTSCHGCLCEACSVLSVCVQFRRACSLFISARCGAPNFE